MSTLLFFRLPAPETVFRGLTLLLFLAFSGCSSTDDPVPAAGTVTVSLVNNATWLGKSASVCLRDTPMRTPGDGKALWSSKVMSCKSVSLGPLAKNARLYLSLQYDDVNSPNYLLPTKDEYIQAELLVDGKKVARLFLNADSFNTSANYFPATATRTHLMQEVEVAL